MKKKNNREKSSADPTPALVRKRIKRFGITKASKADERGTRPPKPTIESILDEADKAFTGVVRSYMVLGEAYVKAITYYGSEGKSAFKARFPLTDNALRNLEYVGRGRLLPQFAMCSDKFVGGLVNMDDSLSWQYKLLGASENGKLRIRVGGEIRDIPFEEFKAGAADAVLSIVSKEDVGLTVEQLRQKLVRLRRAARANFKRTSAPPFEIRVVDGKKVVRFLRAMSYSAEELRKILAQLG